MSGIRWLQSLVAITLLWSISGVCADGGCPAPTAESAKTSAIDVPTYTSDVVPEEVDNDADVSRHEWRAYETQVVERLTSSPSPRDWAFAVMLARSVDAGRSSTDLAQLLKRAAKSAADDGATLWTLVAAARALNADSVVDETMTKLQALEPDNAAVWSETLQHATKAKDRTGVDVALTHMATSSRFDLYLSDLSGQAVDAFTRTPPPASLLASLGDYRPRSPESLPYIYMTVITSTYALPAMQHIVNACRNDPAGKNSYRLADCQSIGRAMSRHSDTLLATMIGFAVLRVSKTFDDGDVQAARDYEWVYEKSAEEPSALQASETQDGLSPAMEKRIVERNKDWIASGSEMEAMRRTVARNGLPETPPEDWVEKNQRFGRERLEQDEQYAVDHPIDF